MTGTWKGMIGAAAFAVLAACGGGGGGYGGGGSTQPPPPPSARSVVTVGTITGFGSVYVNGVRYDTSAAQIFADEQPVTQRELKVGQVVQLKGTDDGTTARAARIDFDDAVQGPVASIDLANSRLEVLGQTVLVTSATSFDDRIPGSSLAGLAVGNIVEVSGLTTAAGEIEATRIEPKAVGPYEVTGKVSALDPATRRFRINALVVDYAAALLEDFPGGAPRDGDLVEAKGNGLGAGGELLATKVELKSDDRLLPDAGGEFEVEGLVTRFVSPADFDVAGRPVTTTGTTIFEGGVASDLARDVKVEAEGTLNSAGVLVAAKVKFKRAGTLRIAARVDSVDVPAGRLTVLGLTVATDAFTRFEDKGRQRLETFNLSNLAQGDWVELRGYENPAGSNGVTATRLERTEAKDEVRLRGPFRLPEPPTTFRILSVPVQVDGETEFEREEDVRLTLDEFFAQGPNRVVEARGAWNGTALLARRAEIKTHDD